MPKYEVTVLTKYEVEAEDETRATIACCALASGAAPVRKWLRDEDRHAMQVLSEEIEHKSSDITRSVPMVNGEPVADTLADVDREAGIDCCEICEFPASAGHDAACPKCPSKDEYGNMETGFLSQPKRERESDEHEDVDALLVEGLKKMTEGDLCPANGEGVPCTDKCVTEDAYENHAVLGNENLLDDLLEGKVSPEQLKEATSEIIESLNGDVDDHMDDVLHEKAALEERVNEPCRGDNENPPEPVEHSFRALAEVPTEEMPRVLRRVICHMGAEDPHGAASTMQANMAACSMAMQDYGEDIVFGRDPENKLYIDFEKREVKQMQRPHLLAPGQVWF